MIKSNKIVFLQMLFSNRDGGGREAQKKLKKKFVKLDLLKICWMFALHWMLRHAQKEAHDIAK